MKVQSAKCKVQSYNSKIKSFLFLVCSFGFWFLVFGFSLSLAQTECQDVPLPLLGVEDPCSSPAAYIQYWFYFSLYLAGIVALLAAVAGGALYMFSATPLGTEKGKNWMVNAVLGLILLFGSWLLLTTLGGEGLTKLKNPELPPLGILPGFREGTPCKIGSDCTSINPSLKCVFNDPDDTTKGGTCYDGSDGDPCNAKIGGVIVNQCQSGLECIGGKCAVRPTTISYCNHLTLGNQGCYDTSNCDGLCSWPSSCEEYTGAIADCPDGTIK